MTDHNLNVHVQLIRDVQIMNCAKIATPSGHFFVSKKFMLMNGIYKITLSVQNEKIRGGCRTGPSENNASVTVLLGRDRDDRLVTAFCALT